MHKAAKAGDERAAGRLDQIFTDSIAKRRKADSVAATAWTADLLKTDNADQDKVSSARQKMLDRQAGKNRGEA